MMYVPRFYRMDRKPLMTGLNLKQNICMTKTEITLTMLTVALVQ